MSTERNGAAAPHEDERIYKELYAGGSTRVRLLLIGAIAPVLLWAACAGNDEGQPNASDTPGESVTRTSQPLDSGTPTPLVTPEFTPGMPFTKIPNVPDKFRVSTRAIYDYLITQRLAGNRLRLVDNDVYDLDVFRAGTGETEITYGLTVKIKDPGSVLRAREIRNQVCADLFEATGSVAAELSIQFGVAVPNAGENPMYKIGFTPVEAQDFTQVTTCGAVTS